MDRASSKINIESPIWMAYDAVILMLDKRIMSAEGRLISSAFLVL